MNISERLRERRSQLGMTQEGVALAAGMNVTQYNAYERGRSAPSATTLPRLAQALATTQAALLGQDGASGVRPGREPGRESLRRLKDAFQKDVADALGLTPADVAIRIELL